MSWEDSTTRIDLFFHHRFFAKVVASPLVTIAFLIMILYHSSQILIPCPFYNLPGRNDFHFDCFIQDKIDSEDQHDHFLLT